MNTPPFLIVDDSATVRNAVRDALESDGQPTLQAQDGLEALDLLREGREVGLILLDIDMPRMNGYQLCKLLKSDPVYSRIPIVLLTAKSAESDRAWGMKAGADDYLPKPFNYAKVKELIRRLTEERSRRWD